MLGHKIAKHRSRVYLINTGWSGGPYGVGRRISLLNTRAIVRAALQGDLEEKSFKHDNIFNLDIPVSCPGLSPKVLDPRDTWSDKQKYDISARRLASLFVKNFEKFDNVPDEIRNAGPRM
jgi:phosphoenolpyruvate carboxykinase (ATP)